MSAPKIDAEGVTNPSIDDLLTKTDSKYKLVLYLSLIHISEPTRPY